MTNTKNSFWLILTIGIAFTASIGSQGCSSTDSGYDIRLDSLDQMISETKKFLQIDYPTIEKRKELIFDHMRYVDQFYDHEMSKEFANNLSKYKGIKKGYTHFLNEFEKISDRTEVLEKQATDLRTSVEKNELSKDEFKKFYTTEKQNILENRNAAEQLATNIYSLEPEYQRISRTVYEELKRIAETNEKLDSYLQNLYSEADTTG